MDGNIILEDNINNATEIEANRTASELLVKYEGRNKTIVIITAESDFLPALMKAMHLKNVTKDNGYDVVTFNLDQLTVHDAGENYCKDVMFMDHSSNEMNPTTSDILDFRKSLTELAGYDVPIISTMAYVYNIMQLLSDSILSSSSTAPSLYREYMYHTALETRAYGIYEIYSNGLARGEIQIFRVYIIIIII